MSTHNRAGTKIVATLGPATNNAEALGRLLAAGVDVVRLNFSHGTPDDHAKAVVLVRSAAASLGRPIALMGDLCGPKIRLLEVQGSAIEIPVGHRLRILREPVLGTRDQVATNHPTIIDDAEVGHAVLINDGAVQLRVVEKTADALICECDVPGEIGTRKGLSLPDSDLRQESLTDKDLEYVRWSVSQGLDYIALSFVRRAADVELLRTRLAELQGQCHVVSKIETRHAVANLDEIIAVSDAVIGARGDLGVEMELATVPRIQKDITHRCHRAGKPVIVATQMLQSMVESSTPTRAEVSDVANAVFDGADALLLSAETAVGRYPDAAVRMLHSVAAETEAYDQNLARPAEICAGTHRVTAALARAIARIANDVDARAVVLWTDTGYLTRLASKHRLDRPVIGIAHADTAWRRMALYYGITPVLASGGADVEDRLSQADRIVQEMGVASPGQMIIVAFGPRAITRLNTGTVLIHTVNPVDFA